MDPDPTTLHQPIPSTEPRGSLRKAARVFVAVFVAVAAALFLLLALLGILGSALDSVYELGAIPMLVAFAAEERYRQTGSLNPFRSETRHKRLKK
jgi:hypothetical protein